VADLTEVSRRFRPDAIVADASMWGPALVMREAQGRAVALLSPLIYAVIPGQDIPPLGSRVGVPRTRRTRARARVVRAIGTLLARPGRRRIDQLRANHGLPPLEGSVNQVLGRLPLYLVASIPGLDLDRHDLPPGVHYVGPLLWHPPDPAGTAEWLNTLPADRPWVHVTEGTSHHQDPFLLRAGEVGLAGAPYEAILTTGRSRADSFSATAPNVHVRDWLAHDTLLPRCSALVTTGGAGTTMAGLRAGLPLVLVPTSWDKPDIALRMVEAGVAVRVPPRRCTPQALRAAVDEVLGDPRYRENARRVAGELAAAPGAAGAADHIQALATESSPAAAPAPVFAGRVRG
jgi:UDP:flavonoid glycosyltransferase YjiC (YdhE family)